MATVDEDKASRKEPHAFSCTAVATIHKPAAAVFDFIVKDLPDRHAMFQRSRERFDVTEAGEIVEHAAQGSHDPAGDQPAAGHVELKKVPNRLISASFCPESGDFGAGFIRKMSVYYDLGEMGGSETLLTMTSVVQLATPLIKLLATVIGIGKLLGNQMAEELNELKNEIETGEPGTSELDKELDSLRRE